MTPERIFAALMTGTMQVNAGGLTDAQKRTIAEYLSERKLVDRHEAEASAMSNSCQARSKINLKAPSWNGWGVDLVNSRYQPARAAGLSVKQASRLKLKWAFGLPGATSVYCQPALVGERVYVAADTGYLYALNAGTGCVHWSYQALAGVHTSVTVAAAPNRPGRYNVYFGDMRANIYAVDADSGELVWTVRVEEHALAGITGSPTLNDNVLYVPVSSREESSAGNLAYPCCTFRGSLVALDTTSGRQSWKTYTISDVPKPTRRNSRGTQQWGPAGAAIWSSPTMDERRGLVYVATGNSYTQPAARTTDAVIAFDMKTGAIVWSAQATESDSWIVGCGPTPVQRAAGAPAGNKSENCPDDLGPDHDFAASPMLVRARNREMLVTGQKSGMIAALDPGNGGALLWQISAATRPVGPLGEIVWGGATDGTRAYYGLNAGSVIAVTLATGRQQWRRDFTPADKDHTGNNSAITLAGPVVLSGGWDGVVRALNAKTGAVLWAFSTAVDFSSVNGVAAKGGSIGGPGPVVVNGTVYVNSGYIGVQRGLPGNVLLAFSPE
jgi:polyvinyl alcohol dehydrogenase (cytochrome)